MKILYVLRYWPTLTETFVYREIAGLLARGVAVEVVAIGTREDGDLQDELPPVRVTRPPSGLESPKLLPALLRSLGDPVARSRQSRPAGGAAGPGASPGGPPAVRGDVIAWGREHLRPKDLVRAVWLADHARRIGADRLHAHFAGEAAEWARVAAALTGIPYSVTVHAVDLFRPRPSLPDVLRDASPVVTIAEHHRRFLRERYDVDAVVVRCGVSLDRPLADPGSPGLRVIAVGRWVPKKGLDLLVDAIEPPASLRLVSDGPPQPGIPIGPLPPSRVPAALAEAHLFALPCRVAPDGDMDGIPVALLEAMAAGLPVVTTPVSGIPEVVDDEVGWLVPPDDLPALREALRAARDPAERARRGSAARERIASRGLTVDAQVEGLLAAWTTLVPEESG